MASDRFFEKSGPLNLEEISRICGDAVEFDRLNDDQKALKITDVASLQSATQDHISFLDNVKYKEELKRTNAGVVILHENMLEHLPSTSVPLICKEPYKIYAMIAACFYPESISVASKAKLPSSETVIHPTAIISDIAKIGQGCHIGPYVVIEDDVEIGANTKIEASSMITKGCRIGEQCHIGAHVSLNC